MNNLLIFFALPVATVILAIVFQKILKNPLLVAATFFAIYLIVTFAAFDVSFLVYAILYTILAYITALLVCVICRLINTFQQCCNRNNNCNKERICSNMEGQNNDINPLVEVNNTCPGTTVNLNTDTALITANQPVIRRTNGNGCSFCCRRR